MRVQDDALSLRTHLVNWLFTPLYLLFLFSLVAGYIAAVGLANRPFDLLLIERGQQVATRLQRLDSPSAAQALAHATPQDLRVALYDESGRHLGGDPALPKPRPIDLEQDGPRLHDIRLADERIRLLTLILIAPDGVRLALQVGEPIGERLSLSRRILGYIVIPQVLVIAVAALAVWIGLKKGLAPLERLRRALSDRMQDDLDPLDATQTPSEVRPFILEINALLDRLRHNLDIQRRFVADAAHQLRTPFAGLKAQAELARRNTPEGEMQDTLGRICDGAQRCTRLVNQLLALARNEPQALVAKPDALLDLRRLAREAAMRWAPEALHRGIDLGFDADARQLPVRGSESGLNDLLDNLLDNAVRYTRAPGHVTVRLGYDEGAWLRVEDDGPGIPVSQREKVFERFWRPPDSAQAGSGLGLSIVAEVAISHGAHVRVDAGPGGRGTVFEVRFPHHGGELSVHAELTSQN